MSDIVYAKKRIKKYRNYWIDIYGHVWNDRTGVTIKPSQVTPVHHRIQLIDDEGHRTTLSLEKLYLEHFDYGLYKTSFTEGLVNAR